MPGKDHLNWIHVSDLHFGHGDGATRFDQRGVAAEILEDVERVARARGTPDYVFVTGDIAFSATPAQYEAASVWLDDLLKRLGLDRSRALLVPGNHDVDRAVLPRLGSAALKGYRANPRLLDDAFEDSRSMKALWAKLEAYQRFASSYGPPQREISPTAPFWREDLVGVDGPIIAIGLNTTLLSFDDDDGPDSLRLGIGQITKALAKIPRGALLLVLQHHPPSWLGDGAALLAEIKKFPHLLFSGHVHEARAFVQQPFDSGGIVQIVAGAGHADAGEAGTHAYTWGTLHAGGIRYQRRIWSREERAFVPAPMRSPGNEWHPEVGEYACIEGPRLPRALQDWLAQRAPVQVAAPPSQRSGGSTRPPSKKLKQLEDELKLARAHVQEKESDAAAVRQRVTGALAEGSLVAVRQALGLAVPAPAKESTSLMRDWALPLGCLVVALVSFAIGVHEPFEERTGKPLITMRDGIDYMQFMFVLGVFLYERSSWRGKPVKLRQDWAEGATYKAYIDHFFRCWLWLWGGWVGVYAIYALHHIWNDHGASMRVQDALSPRWSAGVTFFVNLTSAALFALRRAITTPTGDDRGVVFRRLLLRALIVCAAFTTVEAGLGEIILGMFGDESRAHVSLWAGIVGGLGNAMMLALLVGQLGRSSLAVHSFEVAIFYLYAATQPLYPIARLAGTWPAGMLTPQQSLAFQFIIKGLSIAPKLGMLWVIHRQVSTGRLAFHLWKASIARRDTPAEWELFRQERLQR